MPSASNFKWLNIFIFNNINNILYFYLLQNITYLFYRISCLNIEYISNILCLWTFESNSSCLKRFRAWGDGLMGKHAFCSSRDSEFSSQDAWLLTTSCNSPIAGESETTGHCGHLHSHVNKYINTQYTSWTIKIIFKTSSKNFREKSSDSY